MNRYGAFSELIFTRMRNNGDRYLRAIKKTKKKEKKYNENKIYVYEIAVSP